jgi:glucose/arabinose dehydrogenase
MVLVALLFAACGSDSTGPSATPIALRKVADLGPRTARLVRDPVSGRLHALALNGDVLRLSLGATASVETVYTAADTGVPTPQGLAFAPDGALFLVGNENVGADAVSTIRRGVRVSGTSDVRMWSTVARTVPYPRSGQFDHQYNGAAVSPDGRFVFVNAGSRTEHGEIETSEGRYPGLREVPLTALILRLPADGRDIVLPNDDARLGAAGYVFARGVRNTFDLAFSSDGDLFGAENSGDRDDSDELNWIREGRHYGFPWRMGTNDTPQQFPGYDPAADKLLNYDFRTGSGAAFYNDPTFPPRPATPFTDPIPNRGPHANSFRDPLTGQARRAEAGTPVGTFTAHRSPLGLAFDVRRELPGAFRGAAFVLGWTPGNGAGDAPSGPFLDASEDLLQLGLRRQGDSFDTTATSIVCGFRNPIDAEIADGRLYVLEYGGSGSVWEVTFPPSGAPTGCATVPR